MELLETGLTRFLEERLPAPLRVTLTDNRRSMFSYRRRPDGMGEVRLARYFALADTDTLERLVAYLNGSLRRLPPEVRAFADRQIPCGLHKKEAREKARPKGERFDLAPIVTRLIRDHFPGMGQATITWGRQSVSKGRRSRKRTIQLGSYRHDGDLITIHPALDADYVAPVYLEMVVYHELLHRAQALETPVGNRPRLVHDARFRKAERAFPGYAEAMVWERENLHRLLRDRSTARS